MHIRHVKRKCSVRGCKNTDCFAISKNREIGNTVIMCKTCMEDALKAAKEFKPVKREHSVSEPPPLFFIGVKEEAVKEAKPAKADEAEKENGKTEKDTTQRDNTSKNTSKKINPKGGKENEK